MPAKSKAQQRYFGYVRAIQEGKAEAPSHRMADVASRISTKDAHDFASTPRKGLPSRVSALKNAVKKRRGR